MFRKLTIVALPALIFALAACSMNDSAFARGGHGGGGGHRGGGHRGGGHRSGGHRVSHSHGSRSRSHNRNRSRNKNRDHHRHHHRYRNGGYGGYGYDGGDDGDGDYTPDGDYMAADGGVLDSITLLNPPETRRMVGFTLDSDQYSLDSAQSQVYDGGTRLITFDRGGSFGQAQYTLQPGTYRFVSTERGWDLRTVTDQVAAK
jgi:hypothetical protein